MKRLAASILAQAARARAGSGHSTIKGAAIEVILRRLLRQYVPGASVGTGQAANSKDYELSPQMDVLLYDGSVFPHLSVNDDSSVVVCCEAVLAAVECKASWDKDVTRHFARFRDVDARRTGWWEKQEDLNAAYFIFTVDKVTNPKLTLLSDTSRSVGVYSLAGKGGWYSPFGESTFSQQDGNALELFLSHVLEDIMLKGPAELGAFTETYAVVAQYFGWAKRQSG